MSLLESLLNDLRGAVRYSKSLDFPYIARDAIESLIRKYAIQTPGDTSDQPGDWQIRGGYVEAIQHPGRFTGREKVRRWLTERGGNAEVVFRGEYEPSDETESVYLKLDSPREPNIVGPGWWVVKTADGIFFAVSDSDFHILYVPRQDR